MSSDSDEPVTVTSSGLPNLPDIADEPLSELTNPEIRLRIAGPVGLRTSYDSAFGKSTLNSIYAYLTGEYYFPKRHYRTRLSPPVGHLRHAVAAEAEIEGYDVTHRENARAFRKAELIALCETVESASDQRPNPMA